MESVTNFGSSLALAAHLRIQHGEGGLRFSQAPFHAQHLLLPMYKCAQAWHKTLILHLIRHCPSAKPHLRFGMNQQCQNAPHKAIRPYHLGSTALCCGSPADDHQQRKCCI